MVTRKWVFLYFLMWYLSANAHNSTLDDEFVELASVVLSVSRNHLKTAVVVVAEHSMTIETAATNMFIMNYLLMEMKESLSVQLYYSELRDKPRNNYIFIVDSAEAFRIIRKRFKPNRNNRHFFFLIVLSKFTPDFYNVMKRIFRTCLLFRVIDVNIILRHPTLGICMHIARFFTENKCRSIQPTLYYRFQKGANDLKTLFPKRNNFHQCPLQVTSRILPPILEFYGNSDDPSSEGSWKNLGGIEGYMLKLISEKLNFSIQLLPFAKTPSYAFDNGTAFGCFVDLLNNKADVAIGGFSASDLSHQTFSTSKLIYHSPLVYVYKPLQRLTALRRLSKPLSQPAWYLLLCINICGYAFILLMRFVRPSVRTFFYGNEINTPIANFISIYLGYPIARMPRRNFARFLLMMWLLLSLVIRNAYQGALYDAIRMDSFFQKPSGLDDLIRQNYTFIVPPHIARLNIIPKHLSMNLNINAFEERFEMLDDSHENLVTVAHYESFKKYMSKAYLNGSRLDCLDEVIFMCQIVMYFPKNSIFLPAFDRELAAFDSAGITKHLGQAFTSQPALLSKIFEKPPLKAFGNDRLVALYNIYLCMTAMSVLAFVLELLSKNYPVLRRILEWLN